jgi:hypothetical protein
MFWDIDGNQHFSSPEEAHIYSGLKRAHGVEKIVKTFWYCALLSGILMVLAFLTLMATGIFFARYFRRQWPDTRPFGLHMWFHVRQYTMENIFQFHSTAKIRH